MLCIIADDEYYYQNPDVVKEKFNLSDIKILPTIEEVKVALKFGKTVGILVPVKFPYEIFGDLLIYKTLLPRHGALTSQEKECKMKEHEVLANKLFLDVYDYKTLPKLEEMAGSKGFIDWVYKIDKAVKLGKKLKPSVFVGMAGCGKSRGVEALANFWKVPMIDLKLQEVLQHSKPYELIDKIFSYLDRTQIKCVLRMDEIEQMLEDKGMMGKLLTLFNNLNTPKGYNLNGVVIATANNISQIMNDAPQFFRHGRWNEKFFVSFPRNDDAMDIMEYYIHKYKVNFIFRSKEGKKCDKISLKDTLFEILELINTVYVGDNLAKNDGKIIYAPSELDYLMERLSMYEQVDEKIAEKEIKIVVPLQKTASEGVFDMYTECKKLGFKDLNDE